MMTFLIAAIEDGVGPDRQRVENLLLRVARGDEGAFEDLYAQTRAAVYALALSILRDHHEAEDVTQGTYVTVWEKAPTYSPQGSPMAWILTIGRNLCYMQLRKTSRQVALTEPEWNALPAGELGLTAEEKLLLQDALSALSDGERQVVLLHAVSGLKHREIAAVLDMSLSGVLSKYHRALKKLRNFVKGDAPHDQ